MQEVACRSELDREGNAGVVVRIEPARLRRAVAGLPPLERMVVRLRYGLAGRDYEPDEVASLLRIPQERVESVERDALVRLRGVLAPGALAA